MTSLKIVSDRLPDNSIAVRVVMNPRRNGEVNFGALEAINRALLTINPDAFDPQEVTAPEIAHNDGHTADGGGIVAHDIAAARLRDLPDVPADDDEGEPIPGYRCANNACSGE